MLKGAHFEGFDEIPICPNVLTDFPTKLISFEEAFQELKKTNPDYNATVCFYKDDYKFDGPSGIAHKPEKWLAKLAPFEAIVQPDYSTYLDFPTHLKKHAIFRMRQVGYYFVSHGVPVYANYRAGHSDTYAYAADGIPKGAFVVISTHGCVRDITSRRLIAPSVEYLIRVKQPQGICVYGPLIRELKEVLEANQVPYRVYETDLDRRLKGGRRYEC